MLEMFEMLTEVEKASFLFIQVKEIMILINEKLSCGKLCEKECVRLAESLAGLENLIEIANDKIGKAIRRAYDEYHLSIRQNRTS